MNWTPQSVHITQLHSGSSGWNDCFQASLLRYLREAGKLDPHGDQWAQLDQVNLATRGIHDQPGQGFTNFGQAEAGLTAYGLPVDWTTDFSRARAAYWGICWVNGIRLQPAQYPPGWFGFEDFDDHFILWLPDGRFNDPLVPSNQDVHYDYASVAGTFGGAYILPSTHHGEDAPVTQHIIANCAGKVQPNHTCGVVEQLAAGTAVTLTHEQTPHWTAVKPADGKRCWVLTANLQAA